ncbi:ComEC/Rec2 family competence protein [Candidatus Dependentiae bacterium]|nr:ComEC/Rec2 family competence protein [Candidatus Dependentiae bacterium]MCC7415335.1 ComEC/Rec2 family competence protein [Campylobacterota bacterium]
MLSSDRWTTFYNLHPISFFVVSFAGGIAVQAHQSNMWVLILASLLMLSSSWLVWSASLCNTGSIPANNLPRAIRTRLLLLLSQNMTPITFGCLLFFVAGMTRFSYEKTAYDALFSRSPSDRYFCTGRVCDITTYHHPYFKKRITITTDTISCVTDQSFSFKKKTVIYLYTPAHVTCSIDDEVSVDAIALKKPKTNADLIRTMRSGVIALIFAQNNTYSIKKTTHQSLNRYLFDLRARTLRAVCAKIDSSLQPLYTALFLGNKHDIPMSGYITHNFSLWGISHHLARSGLHLIIAGWLLVLFLQRLPILERSRYLLLAVLGCSYYLLSWSSISFDRACFSFILYKIGNWGRTPLDPMHAISLVMLSFLCISPAYLLCLDFQLSFGLTYALAWFNHAHTKRVYS